MKMPFSIVLLSVFLGPAILPAAAPPPKPERFPLFFIEEAGSADPCYAVASSTVHAQFASHGVTFESGGKRITARFPGASPTAALRGKTRMAAKANFLLGQDASAWHLGMSTFEEVVYTGLYSGIDLTYSGQGGVLKSQFTVASGADPQRILVEYSGIVQIGADGTLSVRTSPASLDQAILYEAAPELYQDSPTGRRRIEGRFRKQNAHTVGFQIGPYDHSLPLVIDPTISYSTYLGGTGQGAVTGLALDSAGNLYATGWTEALNFPVAGALQGSNQGGVDAFILKLNSTGSTLLYATYIGGQGDDRGAGIAVDTSGQAYVTGSTESLNFPVVVPVRATLGGARSAFALKLNVAGNALLYSTYLAGSIYQVGNAIALDSSGNAFIAGDTQSTNYPVVGAIQATLAGGSDAFVTKLSPNGILLFSTYLGGSANDHAGGIAVDSSGSVYVAGGTLSTNFPVSGPIQSHNGGGQDAFVTKISSTGSQILYSTYLGGSGALTIEEANAVAVNSAGNAYVAGVTNSSNFPVTSGAFQTLFNGTQDAFISMLNPAGNGLVYSTYLGGTQFDWAAGIGLDAAGNAYVAGYTSSSDFATVGSLQGGFGGLYDAFVSSLSPSGNALGFSTFYGGSGSDVANAIAVDANGNVFVGGQSSSQDLPLAGAIQSVNNGGSIGWVARFGVTAPPPQLPSTVSVTPSSGSGSAVTFVAQYSDTAGAVALTTAALLLNTTTSTALACYVTYNAVNNTFSLANDNPATGSFTVIPGGVSQQNSQCQLNGVGTSAAFVNGNLALTLSVNFQTSFSGTKNIYLYAADAGANSGYAIFGSWTATIPPPQPSADSVSPNAASGAGTTFTFVFSDTQMASNLTSMSMLFATSVGFQNVCYIIFDPNAGTLTLLQDNGSSSNSRPIGGTTQLQNSQCTVGTASVRTSGLSQLVTISVAFKSAFNGAKTIFMAAAEGTLITPWALRGTYTVAAGIAPSKVGIFRSGFFWLLDVNGDQIFQSPPDRSFAFGGVAGDIPITGDWNGSGTTKVGVYRPSNGLFVLDYDGDGQFTAADKAYNIGVGIVAGDVPVVGDWNGNGKTKVGLFRSGFFWILDYNGNGVFEQTLDKSYAFGGVTGDVPVVGDWNGSGTSKIGLFRGGYYWILDANGNGTLDNINGVGGDQAFPFGGINGDVPLVGDWNGDGKSKVGIFRSGFFWVLDANGNTAFDGTSAGEDYSFAFGGIAGDKPVVGKW